MCPNLEMCGPSPTIFVLPLACFARSCVLVLACVAPLTRLRRSSRSNLDRVNARRAFRAHRYVGLRRNLWSLFSHNGIRVDTLKSRLLVVRFAMTTPLRRTVPWPRCTRNACSRFDLRKHRNQALERLTACVESALHSFSTFSLRVLSPYTRQAPFRTTRVRIRYNFREVRGVERGRRSQCASARALGGAQGRGPHDDARWFAPLRQKRRRSAGRA